MIKKKELLVTKQHFFTSLYEFPKYTLVKPSQLKTDRIKPCFLSTILNLVFGSPEGEFLTTDKNNLLVIDSDGEHWSIEHGYLNMVYHDFFRMDRVKPVVSVKSNESNLQFFVSVKVASLLGFIQLVDKIKEDNRCAT